ncbi:MAG: hypothetical protein AB7V13_18815 [Pseudorhodoplanes sp.]|uniref:hypothetical protein n=1 Tax=Pseudorhodoplanes sp. TaxID=1934341 RepID=UPI003D1351DD
MAHAIRFSLRARTANGPVGRKQPALVVSGGPLFTAAFALARAQRPAEQPVWWSVPVLSVPGSRVPKSLAPVSLVLTWWVLAQWVLARLLPAVAASLVPAWSGLKSLVPALLAASVSSDSNRQGTCSRSRV